jgi:hypothetical protein
MLRTANLYSISCIDDIEATQNCLRLLNSDFSVDEVDSLKSFCDKLRQNKAPATIVNDFYVGFEIPQISKEFDLLKIGDIIINIELKSKYNDIVLYQMKENYGYLRFLGKTTYIFCYCANENKIFGVGEDNNLVEVDIKDLIKILENQTEVFNGDLATLFNPSNYLVSPFNSTEKFLNNEYILTSQQKSITQTALNEFNKNKFSLVSIKGNAGTGKSLLLYHIAKELTSPVIVHVGILNEGHYKLIKTGWDIKPIKDLYALFEQTPKAILIDEAQRMYGKQFKEIIDYAKSKNILCIFCHDSVQTLRQDESNAKTPEELEKIADIKFYLTKKIRTNKEIADFIYRIVGTRTEKIPLTDKASIVYFNNISDATNYILSKTNLGWNYITHTPSRYNSNQYDALITPNTATAHEVIGQEFDNVIAVIDNSFYYNDMNVLQSRNLSGNPYLRCNVFIQAITRVKQRLEIVIIENIEVYKKMLSLFE